MDVGFGDLDPKNRRRFYAQGLLLGIEVPSTGATRIIWGKFDSANSRTYSAVKQGLCKAHLFQAYCKGTSFQNMAIEKAFVPGWHLHWRTVDDSGH
jgi:hypothetical protein